MNDPKILDIEFGNHGEKIKGGKERINQWSLNQYKLNVKIPYSSNTALVYARFCIDDRYRSVDKAMTYDDTNDTYTLLLTKYETRAEEQLEVVIVAKEVTSSVVDGETVTTENVVFTSEPIFYRMIESLDESAGDDFDTTNPEIIQMMDAIVTLLQNAEDPIDNLTSTATTRTLSANQGRNLDEKKVDKVDGKGLSTNDYDTTEKQKVSDFNTFNIATENDTHTKDNYKVNLAQLVADLLIAYNHSLAKNNPHEVTKSQLGLENVANVESYAKTVADETFIKTSAKGVSVAELDTNGKVKNSQMPTYRERTCKIYNDSFGYNGLVDGVETTVWIALNDKAPFTFYTGCIGILVDAELEELLASDSTSISVQIDPVKQITYGMVLGEYEVNTNVNNGIKTLNVKVYAITAPTTENVDYKLIIEG